MDGWENQNIYRDRVWLEKLVAINDWEIVGVKITIRKGQF
jgi:hypothetical protein